MLSIQTDVNSLNIQNNLNTSNSAMQTAVERLSSGFRINTAADDAAGYAIAGNLSAENAGLQAGSNNAMQASAMLNIANSAVTQIQNMLVRLQTLATEAASANNSTSADANLQVEAGKLLTEIDNIVSQTQYNGETLLNGSLGSSTSIQVGGSSGDTVSIDMSKSFGTSALGISGLSVSNASNATAALGSITSAIGTLTTNAATLGAGVNQLNYVNAYLSSATTQMSSAISTIKDANMAQEMADYTKSSVLVQAGTSMLAKTNMAEQNILALFK